MTDSSQAQAKLAQAKLIRTEIPTLLAKLVQANQRQTALDLLIAWGTRQKNEETIWAEAKALLS